MYRILILVLLAATVSAINLHGQVYNQNLQPLSNIVVQINTIPAQQIVTSNGLYRFEVSPGTYTLSATQYIAGKAVSKNQYNVTLADPGSFQYDLLLYTETEVIDEKPFLLPWLLGGLFILVLVIVIIALVRRKQQPQMIQDSLIQEILDVLKKHGGRISQKDLRKELPWSESKVSAVVTQLETEQTVEKIKKGRTNILVLKK